jgi:hypothetical protein
LWEGDFRGGRSLREQARRGRLPKGKGIGKAPCGVEELEEPRASSKDLHLDPG